MSPAITIVIPHLRQWRQLDDCLRSLGSQTVARDSFDIIVVDNGSADFEAGRGRLAANWPGVRVLTEAEAGPGPARNAGIMAAQTGMIACIDADCIANERWVETAIVSLQGSGHGTVYGGDVRIAYKDPARLTALEAYESVFGYRQKMYIQKKHFSGTGNLAFWKADFMKIGPFAGITVAEDADWGRRLRKLGLRLLYQPGMIVCHPARDDYAQLESKWTRHIAHDLLLARGKKHFGLRWAANTAAVALSWIPHLAVIWTSDRLSSARARMKGCAALIRIRLFRAAEMIRQIAKAGSEAHRWNR